MKRAPLAIVIVLRAGLGRAVAEDWLQWRGRAHNGVSAETSNWPAGWPPKRLWSANVGAGCTSPIIAQGRLFVMGWAGRKGTGEGTDTVHCFECRTGRRDAIRGRLEDRRRRLQVLRRRRRRPRPGGLRLARRVAG